MFLSFWWFEILVIPSVFTIICFHLVCPHVHVYIQLMSCDIQSGAWITADTLGARQVGSSKGVLCASRNNDFVTFKLSTGIWFLCDANRSHWRRKFTGRLFAWFSSSNCSGSSCSSLCYTHHLCNVAMHQASPFISFSRSLIRFLCCYVRFWKCDECRSPRTLHLCASWFSFVQLCIIMYCPTLPWRHTATGVIHPVFPLITVHCVRRREGFFPAGSVQVNLSDGPSGIVVHVYHIFRIGLQTFSLFFTWYVFSPFFWTSLAIRFTSGCGQLLVLHTVCAAALYARIIWSEKFVDTFEEPWLFSFRPRQAFRLLYQWL